MQPFGIVEALYAADDHDSRGIAYHGDFAMQLCCSRDKGATKGQI